MKKYLMKKDSLFGNKLLKALVVGGVITISAVNPFFGVVTSLVIRDELRKRKWVKIRDNMYYLKRQGFININKNRDNSYTIRPTVKGKRHIDKSYLNQISIQAPKKWDGNWRLVTFDIPVIKQKFRLILLGRLKKLGFIMLQKSIWAHPFECRKEVEVLTKEFKVNQHAHYLVCHEISGGEQLKKDFEKRNGISLI